MSRLRARTTVFGNRPKWREDMWPRFIEACCTLIEEAFVGVRKDPGCTRDKKECWFAAATVIRLRDLCDARSLPFTIEHEHFVLARAILEGRAAPDEAPRIDVCVRHMGMRWTKYLPIEAKVLTTKSIGARRPDRSVTLYVSEGLCRFVDGRYGADVDFGVMLGFILSGSSTTLAKRIAKEVTSQKVPFVKNITGLPPGTSRYESEHPRGQGKTNIHIRHLLLRTDL